MLFLEDQALHADCRTCVIIIHNSHYNNACYNNKSNMKKIKDYGWNQWNLPCGCIPFLIDMTFQKQFHVSFQSA